MRGTSFIMRFVVHVNAVLWRALWMRLTAIPSCYLATSIGTALTIWHLSWSKGVVLLGSLVAGGMALGVLEPSQMFLNWNQEQ